MPGEHCDYRGCNLQIRERCHQCHGSYCARHIEAVAVSAGYGGATVYTCAACLEENAQRAKAANQGCMTRMLVSAGLAVLGALIIWAGASAGVGFIVGFGIVFAVAGAILFLYTYNFG